MDELEALRAEIDRVNGALRAALMERRALVERIAALKAEREMAVVDPAREAAMLAALTEGLEAEEAEDLRAVFAVVLERSRARVARAR